MNELSVSAAPRTETLLRAYALAKARYSSELGERRLVLPDSRDFPDPFLGDAESARNLLRRMQVHAGMQDIPISLSGVDPSTLEERGANCSSGACSPAAAPSPSNFARVIDEGDAWSLAVPAPELRHPVLLTSGLVRSLALVFLIETERPGDLPPNPFQVELLAVLLGFGGILLQGAHVYQKSCAGPRIDQFTALGVSDAALLCALMAKDSGSGLGRLPRLVEATQEAALSEAQQILARHSRFLHMLAEDPTSAARMSLDMETPVGLWGKLAARFRSTEQLPGDDRAWQKALASSPRPKTPRALPSQELIDLVKSEL